MNNAAQIHYSAHLNNLENLATQPLGINFQIVLTASVNYLHGFLVAMQTTNQISPEEYQRRMTHLNATEINVMKLNDTRNCRYKA